jgi:hypothetical protein
VPLPYPGAWAGGSGTDDKYAKLVQEYTALKANNAILKRGLLSVCLAPLPTPTPPSPLTFVCLYVVCMHVCVCACVCVRVTVVQAQEANATLENAAKVKDQRLRKVDNPTYS